MRRPCREVKRFLESGAERLPEALQAHLQQCARCQHALRLEQAYWRALHAARSETVPSCDMPWTRIQAQLASRAVARRAPLWQRYAYASGLAVALLVASLAWLNRAPQATPDAAHSEPNPAVSVQSPSQAGEPRARLSPDKIAERPPTPKRAASNLSEPRVVAQARTGLPATSVKTAAPRPTNAQPTAEMTHYVRPRSPAQLEQLPSASESGRLTPGAIGERLAFQSGLESEAFAVASLPLSQFELYNSSQVEYLPVRYGASSSKSYNEGNQNDAIICSF